MPKKDKAAPSGNSGSALGFEATLWATADKLRGNLDAAEYKHVVLGLIFLKYISDAFEEKHAELQKIKGADPEDRDEYTAENIFWVPPDARWSYLRGRAKDPVIGKLLDSAMLAIERDNPSLKGVLPKDYARPHLDKQSLGGVIDLVSTIGLGDKESRSKDIIGRVYEYFLSEFASAEGKKGGQFYTPRCVVQLLVEMLEPFKGRVYDPCCGSGGMFVQSIEFVNAHANGNGNGGKAKGDISIFGQESNPTTWRLARMNLAIRGVEGIRNKPRREALAKRFKDPKDNFKIVIVRDMWLTGFDAPSLHTMYADKPMRSHGLMQAIARVNRVFKDKPGGLVVDYLGLAHELKQALAIYTESGGHGRTAIDQEEAVAAMLEKYEICSDYFHGFDWSKWTKGKPAEKLSLLPAAQEFIYAHAAKEKKPDEYKQKFLRAGTLLSQAFALSVPHAKAIEIRDDVGFFQAVRAAIAKNTVSGKEKSPEEIDHAIRQIISRAVSSNEVVDIFAAAGLKKPDISVLSDDFLAEVRGMPQKNLAVELLRKLLNNEIKIKSRKFLIQSKSFADMLENAIHKYQNRAIETAAVIEELIQLAKEMRQAEARGQKLGLSDAEVAFYDALETNDSAVKALGDDNLKFIAQELLKTIRENISLDWTAKESVRAKLRVMVKRVLRKYGYPPDKQEKATQTILQQAELICAEAADE